MIKKFIQNIFSVKSSYKHIIIIVLGIKITIKNLRLKDKIYYSFGRSGYQGEFVPLAKDSIEVKNSIKLLAFYLPQFHTFKENEEWHGRGFTEWTNVTKAFPMYSEHFQPQLPIDVGFYDLSTDKVMYRQIELAKQYGVYGFCFHYYWFSGKRLMETPIYNYLNNKELDLPFCLCWANENWSKRWDGGNNELLIEQKLESNDWKKFAEDIAPFLKDERYIRVAEKPMLIIYRPAIFEKTLFLDFISNLKKELKNYGIEDVYFVMARTFKEEFAPSSYGMDAAVEFPPHKISCANLKNDISYVNPEFSGIIFDLEDYINNKEYLYEADYPLFKTVFPNWDNTARRLHQSHIYPLSPKSYSKWLSGCIDWTRKNNDEDRQIVFVNAWNEWAEGAHLEPDNKNGYAYLSETRKVLESL